MIGISLIKALVAEFTEDADESNEFLTVDSIDSVTN